MIATIKSDCSVDSIGTTSTIAGLVDGFVALFLLFLFSRSLRKVINVRYIFLCPLRNAVGQLSRIGSAFMPLSAFLGPPGGSVPRIIDRTPYTCVAHRLRT